MDYQVRGWFRLFMLDGRHCINEFQKHAVTKTRTLFWLLCIQGTCVADGAHQTPTYSPLTFMQFSWFQLSPCSVCCMNSYGPSPSVLNLYANVSEPPVCSIFTVR
jgi:hypothetical protein